MFHFKTIHSIGKGRQKKNTAYVFQEFIDKRKEITFNPILYEGIVNCQGTQRNDFLNHKVVAF